MRMSQFVKEQTKAGRIWISLGGGHDYGYGDGAGFIEGHLIAGQRRPLILNFDAHLDVRPIDRGFTSGTPFFRIRLTFHRLIPL